MSLEMLTEAADLVETREEQKRRMESPDPEVPTSLETKKVVFSNHVSEASFRNGHNVNEDLENRTNGTAENRRQDHARLNGSAHETPEESCDAKSTRAAKKHDENGNKDDTEDTEETSVGNRSGVELLDPAQHFLYQQRLAGQANGIQARGEKTPRTEEKPSVGRSPERFPQRRPTSPATDKGGDTHAVTKPMVLLQHPSASTLSSVGSTQAVPLTNPVMHHPYMYPMMYPAAGVTAMDPALGALGRVPASVLKDGEGQTSPPNGSPNASLASGLQFSAGLMYPFANPALLMGARPPGTVADISPLLLAQSSAGYSMVDQYKRFLEGMQQFPAAYSLQPQMTEQYLKSLATHGLDGSNDSMGLNAMIGRLPLGVPLAALQSQPGAADAWLRYPEQLTAAMGMVRPQDGMSSRSGSPYTGKRRTDSPAFVNGSKIAPSSYQFHSNLGQPQLNSLREAARSPATSMYSQSHRPRSPAADARKLEAERLTLRPHSRDLDREAAPATMELASVSTTRNHTRTSHEHLVSHSYSVTDPQTGRKIATPFYDFLNPVPPGYPLALAVRPPGPGRTPSPRSRPRDERSYRRTSNDRSPAEMQVKRRSLESEYAARNSPNIGERHNSRPVSPATNGLPTSRPQLPHVNGSTNPELAKFQHLLQSSNHTRSPNPGFAAEAREPRSTSPVISNQAYLAAGVPPYFAPHILGGLTAAASSSMAQYAQALAAATKRADLASFYKPGENVSEYARVAGLPPSLPLLAHQQQLLASGRPPHVLPQEYAAALKAQAYYPSPSGAKESGKASPAGTRDKAPGLPQQRHPSFLAQHPPQASSPAKIGVKPKHHSTSQHVTKPAHVPRDSHSPTGSIASSSSSSAEVRRHHSPGADRPGLESPPKHSNKPYRPNSMLRQHAEDLERSRKRKMLEEERILREDGGVVYALDRRGLPRVPGRMEYLGVKGESKDAKRRKQLISEADPEDHFRRSLGKDYVPASATTNKVHVSGNVDDHFKQSLGAMYENFQVAPKSEARDLVHGGPPSYSAAVAFVTQSPRVYPSLHRPDGKEPITSRLYGPSYPERVRYNVPNLTAPPSRKPDQSPPRGAPPTVRYSPNSAIGPARQKVKAKALVPEALAVTSDLRNGHPVRATSVGSKGSSRSVSGSSVESLPAAAVASSPPSPPASISAVFEAVSRPPTISTIPHTFAHQQNIGAASRSAPPITANSGGAPQRERSPPSSPQQGPAQQEAPQKPYSPRDPKRSDGLSPRKMST